MSTDSDIALAAAQAAAGSSTTASEAASAAALALAQTRTLSEIDTADDAVALLVRPGVEGQDTKAALASSISSAGVVRDSVEATINALVPPFVADAVANDPDVAAAAASYAAAGAGVRAVSKAPELARNRQVNPQSKGVVPTTSPAYIQSEITSGLPIGLTYGQQSVREGAASNIVTSFRSEYVPVTPGEVIHIASRVWTNDPATGGTGLDARVRARFANADKTAFTTLDPAAATPLAASTWEFRTASNITVPAGFTWVQAEKVIRVVGGNATTGAVSRTTADMVVSASEIQALTLAAYGDGDQPLWGWLGVPHASASIKTDLPAETLLDLASRPAGITEDPTDPGTYLIGDPS